MIRAVLDSNVIVSGSPASEGPLAEIMNRWRQRAFQLVLSEYILEETVIAWENAYWRSRIDPESLQRFLQALRLGSEVVALEHHIEGAAAHWHDDPILATAVSGEAAFLVTGDKELLRLRKFQGIEILSPRDFLTRLDEASPRKRAE